MAVTMVPELLVSVVGLKEVNLEAKGVCEHESPFNRVYKRWSPTP